jgi:hypothetical protein
MAATPTYLSAVASAAGQGLLTATWIASGVLPTARRRAVRLAASAAVAAAGIIADRNDPKTVSWTPDEGLKVHKDGAEQPRPSATATAAGIALGLSMIIGRHQLEKRWFSRLQARGHQHPHRGLALRMGLLAIAGTLPARLLKAHEARKKD